MLAGEHIYKLANDIDQFVKQLIVVVWNLTGLDSG
jgi:hypothetical protein